jgi:hypothetical protein
MKNRILKYSLLGAGILAVFASTLYYLRLMKIKKINETNTKLSDALVMLNNVK